MSGPVTARGASSTVIDPGMPGPSTDSAAGVQPRGGEGPIRPGGYDSLVESWSDEERLAQEAANDPDFDSLLADPAQAGELEAELGRQLIARTGTRPPTPFEKSWSGIKDRLEGALGRGDVDAARQAVDQALTLIQEGADHRPPLDPQDRSDMLTYVAMRAHTLFEQTMHRAERRAIPGDGLDRAIDPGTAAALQALNLKARQAMDAIPSEHRDPDRLALAARLQRDEAIIQQFLP